MRKAEILCAAETYKMYRTATQKDPGVSSEHFRYNQFLVIWSVTLPYQHTGRFPG